MTTNTQKSTRIRLFSFDTPYMRAFHMSWIAFFLCFFGWFGIAPLMPVIREELNLSKEQIGNIIIASVAITIFARIAIGWVLDRVGPRITYTWLLILGAIPVIMVGLSTGYTSFLIFRLLIGAIGAGFVVTQYHTTMMFAPNVVGTANATTAGWGNLGGGVTQVCMPLFFAFFVGLGFLDAQAWRLAMVIPGILMIVCGILYYRLTTDLPQGNFRYMKPSKEGKSKKSQKHLSKVVKDYRVWVLFLIYGACFGVELTINNIGAIYFHDEFNLSLKAAGLIAGLFGLMNLFARSLGGFFGDKAGIKWGLRGRVMLMAMVLLAEGVSLVFFSQMSYLPLAIGVMLIFSLFVQMAEGATYAVVPFLHRKAIGTVSGIVGAGGNAGAVMAGFLFRSEHINYSQGLGILGVVVCAVSVLALLVRFSTADEYAAAEELEASLAQNKEVSPAYVVEK